MIECIFSLDYEVRGDGSGSLHDLVYEPAEKLAEVFRRANARFVPFVEVSELEIIESAGTDAAIDLVKRQLREFHAQGFTPGLHLHPQWYGAKFENGQWVVDYSEYNLCTLPRHRIEHIVDRALAYFKRVLGDPGFTPLSFRAGNWLFQPTDVAADVLFERGIRIDSSVFKGGVRHEHRLDYRKAPREEYDWRFSTQAEVADPAGAWLELPIYTEMVPFWRMSSAKRLGMERQHLSTGTFRKKLYRVRDAARLWHPLKFDFCRMSLAELTTMVESVLVDDRRTPDRLKPLVAIGHTKELPDLRTIEAFLLYSKSKRIAISTFEDVYRRCEAEAGGDVRRAASSGRVKAT